VVLCAWINEEWFEEEEEEAVKGVSGGDGEII